VRKYQRKLYSQKVYSLFVRELLKHYWYQKYYWYRAVGYLKNFEIRFLGRTLNPEFDDIEAEVNYLLIREFKPRTIVEISPGGGWSTSWILNAIKDNGFGKLYSYDLLDYSTKTIPPDLSEGRWIFTKGDVKKKAGKLPKKIDYLYLDSEHSGDFARWYIQNVFPRLRNGSPVSVHDVFDSIDWGYTEGGVILDWLKQRTIAYFTASLAKEKIAFDEIMSTKNRLGVGKPIHSRQANPAIFFISRRER
jgi:hypothetical protein